jgi:HPt (histidine-containing phosphotransfer) domain-containing protein
MDIQKILTSDVVDLSTIKQYFSSDKDSLIQLVDVYLSDTASKIDILEESLTKVDYESVKSICHYLKSSFGLMGVNCLNEITTLEKKAQNNEPEKVIKEKLNFVIPICRESITEYRLILDGLEAL